MSSEDIAEEIRATFPGTEEIVVQYLAGYLVDDAGEEEDVLQVTRSILKSAVGYEDHDGVLDKLLSSLRNLIEDRLNERSVARSLPTLVKLDKVVDMSKGTISHTIALSDGVDLESINKGK
jgi:ATP-binding cassette subfamily F protein 3